MGGYSSQSIATSNHVDAITAGARGFCECPKEAGTQCITQQKHAKGAYYTYMPHYDAYCPVPLKIVPDSLVYVHKLSSAKQLRVTRNHNTRTEINGCAEAYWCTR